jgi:hypothetical protein
VAISSNCLVSSRHRVRRPAGQDLDEIAGEGFDAVRGFEQHQAAGLAGDFAQEGLAGSAFGGQKAQEAKALGDGVAGHAHGGGDAAGARQGHHGEAGGLGGLHEVGAGVGDGGGAGIADVGDALAGLHEFDQGLGAADFVVLVQGHEALVHAQVAQEAAGDAGVFTGHDIGQGEGLDGAQGDVGQVADGGGDEVERAFGILLAAGHVLGRLEQQIGIDGHNKVPGR